MRDASKGAGVRRKRGDLPNGPVEQPGEGLRSPAALRAPQVVLFFTAAPGADSGTSVRPGPGVNHANVTDRLPTRVSADTVDVPVRACLSAYEIAAQGFDRAADAVRPPPRITIRQAQRQVVEVAAVLDHSRDLGIRAARRDWWACRP
jgi:hypothetical protein